MTLCTYADMYSSISFSVSPSLGSPLLHSIPLFASFVSPVYVLGDPFSFARGANIYPLSSLVSYQLFSPCCLTHPEGTPQIKLHIYIEDINNISPPVWYNDNVLFVKYHSVTFCDMHHFVTVPFSNVSFCNARPFCKHSNRKFRKKSCADFDVKSPWKKWKCFFRRQK